MSLQTIYDELCIIKTHLIKAGIGRRKGEWLNKKLRKANEIYIQRVNFLQKFSKNLNLYTEKDVEQIQKQILKKFTKIF